MDNPFSKPEFLHNPHLLQKLLARQEQERKNDLAILRLAGILNMDLENNTIEQVMNKAIEYVLVTRRNHGDLKHYESDFGLMYDE